jgi:DNA-binding ferritin-like protein
MGDEDQLEPIDIAIEEEKAPEPVEKPVVEAKTPPVEAEKPSEEDPQAAIEALKAQIEAHKRSVAQERAAREQAERQAREYAEQATSSAAEAADGRLTAIQNAIRAVESEANSAEKTYSDALAAGDHATAAKAQRYMASMEARLLQLENGKAAIEDQIEATKNAPAKRPEITPQQRTEDPIDEWASRLTATSRNWVSQHRELFNDPRTKQRIAVAHNAAVDLEGLAPDTPEYFDFIETKIGLKKAAPVAEETSKPGRKPVPAAPVAGGGGSGGSRGNTMTLNSEMREMARNLYPDLQPAEAEKQYAMDRAAMIKAGRISA